MLTDEDRKRIRERVKALKPTREQINRYLETQAAKGNLRAQRALERMDREAIDSLKE